MTQNTIMANYSIVVKSGCQSPLVNVFDDFELARRDFFEQIWIYTVVGSVCVANSHTRSLDSCEYCYEIVTDGVKTIIKMYLDD